MTCDCPTNRLTFIEPFMQPSRTAPSNRFWLAATLVLIVGIVLRQLLLGEASFHPDEAIHTHFSQGFGNYRYDPIYHGPLLYHLVAATFLGAGENDIAARLVPSVLGIGLLALLIGPFRAFASNRAALWGAGLVAVSPSLVTYSRRLLHDSLALFLTLGAVLCFLTALQSGADTSRGRSARIGLFAFLSLFLATKANCFFIAALLLAFWFAWILRGRFRLPGGLERAVPSLLFGLLCALAIAFPRDNSFSEALKISQHRTFTITALLGCVGFGIWLLGAPKTAPVDSDIPTEKPASERTSEAALASENGEQNPHVDGWTTYILAFAAALWIYLLLYGGAAQFIAQWAETRQFPKQAWIDGVQAAVGAIPKMLRYWGGQQATPRLPGRHDYYLVLALLYEIPILVAACGGIWHASKNRSVFTDFLLWWSFASLAVYAVANEKVPWLLVHILLPFAMLGAVWLGQIRWKKRVLALAIAAGLLFDLRGVIGVSFERGGDHVEPLLYAQTPESFRDALENTLAQTRGDTKPVWMAAERQWPSVWYLRSNGPDIGASGIAIAGTPLPDTLRAAISDEASWTPFAEAGWKRQTADFLIWPRASWTAIQPARYLKWFITRDALPQNERDLPQSQWKTSILAGQGEWSRAEAIIGRP